MPEYLAPGVYLEEIDTGSKPIEGVSTSTTGMVGVTERGPTDVPVLITGVGEYTRWFGGQLQFDPFGGHRFLPHALEGFFTNGGKRVFVVRVSHGAAQRAETSLFDRGDTTSVSSRLLRPVSEGTGTAVSPPSLVTLPSGLGANDWIRVGDGSAAEYRQVDGGPVAETVVVPVDLPLARSHPAGDPVDDFVPANFPQPFTLQDDAERGSIDIVVTGLTADVALIAVGDCLQIGLAGVAEYRMVSEIRQTTVISGTVSTARLRLDAGLALSYLAATPTAIRRIDFTAGPVDTVAVETAPAGGVFFVDTRNGNFDDRTHLVRIGTGAGQEVRRIGELSRLGIAPPAAATYPHGSLVEAVTFAAARSLSAAPVAPFTAIVLLPGEAAGLASGQRIVIDPAGSPETVTIQSVDTATDTVNITPALAIPHNIGDAVVPAPIATTAAAAAGQTVLALASRIGLAAGTVLQIGAGAPAQVVTIELVPGSPSVPPNPGNVIVAPGLSAAVPSGTDVTVVGAPSAVAGRQATAVALEAGPGDSDVYVTDGDAFAAGETIRVSTTSGDVTFHTLTGAATPMTGAAAAAGDRPEMVTLQTVVRRAHPAASPIAQRTPLLDVQALDVGQWGNRLRISVEDEPAGLVARTTITTIVNPTTIHLASVAGVQPGTVLALSDPLTGAALGDPVKVAAVNRSAGSVVMLAGTGLSGPQVAGSVVRSREFSITVRLLRQADPANPSRDGQVIDVETFRYLSLDPRHSNYVARIIGDTGGPLRLWDRRPEGTSLYIRVHDLAANQAAAEAVRPGPETLVDVLPTGLTRPARVSLEQVDGFDAIPSIGDVDYVGVDNADPDLRTGLQALRNVEEVSIVGIPGRVGPQVQQALVDHCELMRYRFAVLDSRPEPSDTIADTQSQRQQFDTKYAALYYPWLSIPDPFPETPMARDLAIPPSGHVLGVYARTDIERGVHKAPANEVVRGITGLRRKLNKEQQDILNPYPVNINVIRDFRDRNRGIRVYGGRVITSDPDWKYVNVRRLLIFIEASLERGLQWVVFEPNAEPLWARVRRVISNFLTVVWRNGALEGTKPEEAYFVKCDRTTMTQAEIDNGQLIVVVGVAPVKPAEFVIVRIGLWTAHSDS